MINHDQINIPLIACNKIIDNLLVLIFFSPGDSDTKGSFVLLHPGFEDINEVDFDPNRGFVSFNVIELPLMTEFSVFMLLLGIVSRNS